MQGARVLLEEAQEGRDSRCVVVSYVLLASSLKELSLLSDRCDDNVVSVEAMGVRAQCGLARFLPLACARSRGEVAFSPERTNCCDHADPSS